MPPPDRPSSHSRAVSTRKRWRELEGRGQTFLGWVEQFRPTSWNGLRLNGQSLLARSHWPSGPGARGPRTNTLWMDRPKSAVGPDVDPELWRNTEYIAARSTKKGADDWAQSTQWWWSRSNLLSFWELLLSLMPTSQPISLVRAGWLSGTKNVLDQTKGGTNYTKHCCTDWNMFYEWNSSHRWPRCIDHPSGSNEDIRAGSCVKETISAWRWPAAV
jgi:hypothetical protein